MGNRAIAIEFHRQNHLILPAFAAIFLFLVTSILYATVGQGGGSGYLAVMTFMGMTSEVMKPTSLILNVIASGIATVKFYQAKHFNWQIFSILATASFPCAFLGGKLSLPDRIYQPIVGLVLAYAGWHLLTAKTNPNRLIKFSEVPVAIAILAGMAIGFISGLTGFGGGIFLSPLLILTGWATPKDTAGISAAFIFVNSISGLLGLGVRAIALPPDLIFWALAVAIGGWIGAQYGSRQIDSVWLQRWLGLVLIIASGKMLSILF